MKAETIRGFILGLIVGVTFGVGYVAPMFVDMTANAVVEKIRNDPTLVAEIAQATAPRTQEAHYPFHHFSKEERHCLAKNIYHEAGVEDAFGKIAVGQVTINRMKDGRWGKTVCDVVYAKAQFSWTLSKKKVKEQPKGKLWEESVQVANDIMNGTSHVALVDSLFYHTDYIKTPRWVDKNAKIAQIGQHIFYTTAMTADQLKKKQTT